MFWPTDYNHLPCARAPRDCKCSNSDWPCALHNNGILPTDPGALDSVNGRDQCATGANNRFCG